MVEDMKYVDWQNPIAICFDTPLPLQCVTSQDVYITYDGEDQQLEIESFVSHEPAAVLESTCILAVPK